MAITLNQIKTQGYKLAIINARFAWPCGVNFVEQVDLFAAGIDLNAHTLLVTARIVNDDMLLGTATIDTAARTYAFDELTTLASQGASKILIVAVLLEDHDTDKPWPICSFEIAGTPVLYGLSQKIVGVDPDTAQQIIDAYIAGFVTHNINAVAGNEANINAVADNESSINTVADNILDTQQVAAIFDYHTSRLTFTAPDFRLDDGGYACPNILVDGVTVADMAADGKIHFGDGFMPIPAQSAANLAFTLQMASAAASKNIALRVKIIDAANVTIATTDYQNIATPDDVGEFNLTLPNFLVGTEFSSEAEGRIEIKRIAATTGEHGANIHAKKAVVIYV